jgi:hypothetical protein
MLGSGFVLGVALPGGASAQAVPARDLLEFPIGTVGEAPVMATIAGDGLWNPASILLRNGSRLRVTAASLHGPDDQGVTGQLLAAAYQLRQRTTIGLSIVRASVSNLIRTDSDPQSIGGEIPYSTIVVSTSVAARTHRYLTMGVALRYRFGEIDAESEGALGIDGGVVADQLPWLDARLAASSFLWRPGDASNELTRLSVGGDLRVMGVDTLREVRTGYAAAFTEHVAREHYVFVAGRWKGVEVRGGPAHLQAYGNGEWRFRIGAGLHHARYVVGLGREDSGAGLGPTYSFILTSTFR